MILILLKKPKYNIHMDVDCMIDIEWIDSLKNGGIEGEYVRSRRISSLLLSHTMKILKQTMNNSLMSRVTK